MSGALTISAAQNESLALSGPISGASGSSLTESGGGALLVSGSSSGFGTTSILAGSSIATSSAAVPSGSSLQVGSGGVFEFDPTGGIPGGSGPAFRRAVPTELAPDSA